MNFRIIFFIVLLALAACTSTTRDYKGVYKATADLSDLSIPPGLDSPEQGTDPLPELKHHIKTRSQYEESIKDAPNAGFEAKYEGMNFVREGSLYWLEVKASGEQVWTDLRTFFKRLGFEIKTERPQIGYFETDWLANHVNVPSNFIEGFIDSLFSSYDLMDKYRIRLEWDAEKKVTRVFINHQGLQEVVKGDADDHIEVAQTKWVFRPSDPDLEVEMITRFMAFRGLSEDVAEQNVAMAKEQKVTEIKAEAEKQSLVIYQPFARSWRHVGIAIDRLGYAVEDKNRTAGVYYIVLPETFEIPKQSGLLSNLFTSKEKPKHLKYLIVLEQKGNSTIVTLKSNGEVPDDFNRVEKKVLNDLQSSII